LLGRAYIKTNAISSKLFVISVVSISLSYQINTQINSIANSSSQNDQRLRHLASTRPFDRGVLYVVSTIGVVIVVFTIVSYLCNRYKDSAIIETARITGQMTLTIYLAHIFIYNAVVNWWHLVTPTGLDTAMTMSIAVYISAIIWANWWHHHYGRGPAERIYRHFGG
jgi:uncharacterized membrane protein YeiB